MISHENLLLTDDSHEIAYLFFFRKSEKMSQNLSSASVVIGALMIKTDIIWLRRILQSKTYVFAGSNAFQRTFILKFFKVFVFYVQ